MPSPALTNQETTNPAQEAAVNYPESVSVRERRMRGGDDIVDYTE
jgi:hypothetical protein